MSAKSAIGNSEVQFNINGHLQIFIFSYQV